MGVDYEFVVGSLNNEHLYSGPGFEAKKLKLNFVETKLSA